MLLSSVLPDWVPWWLPVVVLVPVLFFGICLILMPFSVFGTKARLEGIEQRLDEIQGEIRSLAFRLPEPGGGVREEASQPAPRWRRPDPGPGVRPVAASRPPIPPAPRDYESYPDEEDVPPPRLAVRRAGPERSAPRPEPRPDSRSEPRLNWPPR